MQGLRSWKGPAPGTSTQGTLYSVYNQWQTIKAAPIPRHPPTYPRQHQADRHIYELDGFAPLRSPGSRSRRGTEDVEYACMWRRGGRVGVAGSEPDPDEEVDEDEERDVALLVRLCELCERCMRGRYALG